MQSPESDPETNAKLQEFPVCKMDLSAGYREIEHTADWELEVWAPDLAALLEQAARGMCRADRDALEGRAPGGARAGARSRRSGKPAGRFPRRTALPGGADGLGFDTFDLRLDGYCLAARLGGAPLE